MTDFPDRSFMVLLSLLVIVSGSCLIAGCSAPGGDQSAIGTPPTQNPDSGPGTAQPVSTAAIRPEDVQKVSFGEALDALRVNFGTDTTILYIHAEDIDTSGQAKMWAFGLKEDGKGYFFAYTGLGESVVPWPGDLPAQEIELDRMVLPDALVKEHRNLAGQTLQGKDNSFAELELRDGLYTLITLDGKIDTFNPVTGNQVKE